MSSEDARRLQRWMEGKEGGSDSEDPSAEERQRFLDDYGIDATTGALVGAAHEQDTKSSQPVTLQLTAVPQSTFDYYTEVFACTSCGKVFWEGRVFNRIRVKTIKRLTAEDGTLSTYKKSKAMSQEAL